MVNHRQLAAKLNEINKKQKWIIVYHFHQELLKIYEEYNIVGLDKYGNPHKNSKNGRNW